MSKKKKRTYVRNKSKRIPDGTVLMTKDSYLPGGERSRHLGEEAKNPDRLYRKVLVIDTNRENDVAVVEFVSKGNIHVNGKTSDGRPFSGKILPIIHVTTSQGERLRRKDKILITDRGIVIEPTEAKRVRRDTMNAEKAKQSEENKRKLRRMKRRVYANKKGN